MPRPVSRFVEVANERVVGALFFVAMAVASGQGPSWQTVATVGGGIVMAGGGWVIVDRLAQQAERDRNQDQALKDALKENREALKEAFQDVRDLSSSAVNRAGEAISAGLELKSSVGDLKASVAELRSEIAKEREKREAKEAREYEELRQQKAKR